MARTKAPVGKATPLTEVAVLGSGRAARQFARRPPRLTVSQIGRLFAKLGPPVSKMHVGNHHVTLSAQVPWVESRGYLNLINPQSFYAADPNVGFISPLDDGNVEGEIEVWLLGLETGASYLLQYGVGSYPLIPNQPGQWELRSSVGAPSYVNASGPEQTLPVVLLEVDGPMQLATLTSSGLGGWVFYDVEVTRLD